MTRRQDGRGWCGGRQGAWQGAVPAARGGCARPRVQARPLLRHRGRHGARLRRLRDRQAGLQLQHQLLQRGPVPAAANIAGTTA